MASRMIHYAVNTQLAARLSLRGEARGRFLAGGLVPDAFPEKERKQRTHFYYRNQQGDLEVGCEPFAEVYAHRWEDVFIQGYFAHLMADSIWLKTIYRKRVQNCAPEEKNCRKAQYYQDFDVLNFRVRQAYGLHVLPECLPDCPVAEIPVSSANRMLDGFRKDFDTPDGALQLLQWEEVTRFIESACAMIEKRLRDPDARWIAGK